MHAVPEGSRYRDRAKRDQDRGQDPSCHKAAQTTEEPYVRSRGREITHRAAWSRVGGAVSGEARPLDGSRAGWGGWLTRLPANGEPARGAERVYTSRAESPEIARLANCVDLSTKLREGR